VPTWFPRQNHLQDALAAKRRQDRKQKSVAAAAVLPVEPIVPVAVSMPSACLGDGTNSEYVNIPFYTPHLFLDCTARGHKACTEVPIRALIDNGANAVLISPELADNLGLAHHKLPLCKDVVMAVGGRKKEIFSFEF